MEALFDTGSCKTIITYILVKRFKLKFVPGSYELSSANMTRLDAVGIAVTNLKFIFGTECKSADVKLVVINTLAYSLIIGLDILTPFRIVVDLSPPMKLYFSGEKNGVSLIEPIRLPPRSQSIIVGSIIKHNTPEIIMVKPFNFQSDILTAYSVSPVSNNCVDCLVLNLSECEILLQAVTQFAGMESIEISE